MLPERAAVQKILFRAPDLRSFASWRYLVSCLGMQVTYSDFRSELSRYIFM